MATTVSSSGPTASVLMSAQASSKESESKGSASAAFYENVETQSITAFLMNASQASSKEAAGKDSINIASATIFKDTKVEIRTKEEQADFEKMFAIINPTQETIITNIHGNYTCSSNAKTELRRVCEAAFPILKAPSKYLQGVLIFLDGKEYILQTCKNLDGFTVFYDWHIYKYEQVITSDSAHKTIWKLVDLISRSPFVLEEYHSPEDMEQELKAARKLNYYFNCSELRIVKSNTVQRSLHGLIFDSYLSFDLFSQRQDKKECIFICKELMLVFERLWKGGVVHNNLQPSNIFTLSNHCLSIFLRDWKMTMTLNSETYEKATVKGSALFTSVLDLDNIQEAQEHYRKAKDAPKNNAHYQSTLRQAEDRCREAFIQKDLFAAAVTMYKLITCRLPYQSEANGCINPNTAQDAQNITAGWIDKPDTSWKEGEPLRDLIESLLRLNPGDRPSSEEFLKRWHEAFNSSGCVIS